VLRVCQVSRKEAEPRAGLTGRPRTRKRQSLKAAERHARSVHKEICRPQGESQSPEVLTQPRKNIREK